MNVCTHNLFIYLYTPLFISPSSSFIFFLPFSFSFFYLSFFFFLFLKHFSFFLSSSLFSFVLFKIKEINKKNIVSV